MITINTTAQTTLNSSKTLLFPN